MKIITNRFGLIRKYVTDKIVLDVGCVDHDSKMEKRGDWLHKFIKKSAKDLVGIDIDEQELNKLKKKGYDVMYGNIEQENTDLKNRFDVVIAGELIEHLSNTANFFNNCNNYLKFGGHLIITTPNCYSFRNILRSVIFGETSTNPEHTLWHSEVTLRQVVERNGFKIKERYYFFDTYSSKWRYLVERMFAMIHKSFSPNLIFVCEVVK